MTACALCFYDKRGALPTKSCWFQAQEYCCGHWGSEIQVWLKKKMKLQIIRILQYHSRRLDMDKLRFRILVCVPRLWGQPLKGMPQKTLASDASNLGCWCKISSQCFSNIPPLPPSNMWWWSRAFPAANSQARLLHAPVQELLGDWMTWSKSNKSNPPSYQDVRAIAIQTTPVQSAYTILVVVW